MAIGGPLAPDNAQNWYRHQLAELGLVGSVGWIGWVVGFGIYLFRRREHTPELTWSTFGALTAFALMSFVGMPGQEMMVSLTFWTIAAGFVSVAGRPPDSRLHSAAWASTIAIVILYSAGALYAARHDLRVPARAQRFGWTYMYGWYPPEADVDNGTRRWTGRRAVAVVEAPARWLELTVSVDYRGLGRSGAQPLAHAATRPVDARIWRDGELVFHQELTTTAPVTTFVPVANGQRWVFIETLASRVFNPREFGVPDDRELGLRIKWNFIDELPPTANR
jgi:hypothetical protein